MVTDEQVNMTDYSELVKMLRISGHPTPSIAKLLRVNSEAADALEAQAQRIAELEAENAKLQKDGREVVKWWISERKMRAAHDAAAAAAWRPIEEAPTDGTPVLVAWKGENYHPIVMHYEDGMFGWLNENFDFVCRPNKQPNIFRPIPEPPK